MGVRREKVGGFGDPAPPAVGTPRRGVRREKSRRVRRPRPTVGRDASPRRPQRKSRRVRRPRPTVGRDASPRRPQRKSRRVRRPRPTGHRPSSFHRQKSHTKNFYFFPKRIDRLVLSDKQASNQRQVRLINTNNSKEKVSISNTSSHRPSASKKIPLLTK